MDVDLEAHLEGGHIVISKDARELLEDSFLKSNFIEQIQIKAFNLNPLDQRRTIMIFLRKGLAGNVFLELDGDRQAGTETRRELENIIKGKREWYAWLFIPTGWAFLSQLIWCVVIGAICGATISRFFPGQWVFTTFAVLIGALVLGLGSIFLFYRMFPRIAFEIGASRRKSESAKLWRITVGSVLFLGILAAVIGGLIVEWIK
jgi:hypothetical protein